MLTFAITIQNKKRGKNLQNNRKQSRWGLKNGNDVGLDKREFVDQSAPV
ncbi:MAG: hypothetical protein Q4C95_07755 [Planctomycetia bacterium]|nr:hypothetical protein [Planctomycetia bacterium]